MGKIFLPLYILIWLLIKVGQIPELIARLLIKTFEYIIYSFKVVFRDISKIQLPRLKLDLDFKPFLDIWKVLKNILSYQMKLPVAPKKGRGRPKIILKKNNAKSIFSFLKLFKTKKKGRGRPRIVPQPVHSLRVKKASLPKISTPNWHFWKKGRGRPRTTPFLIFWKRKIKRFVDFVFPTPLRIATGLVVFISIFVFYSFLLVDISHDLPNPKKLTSMSGPTTTQLYDRKGRLLYQIYDGRNRSLVNLEELPKHLQNATIAMEDQNFYEHFGFDLFGILRAARAYFQDNQIQGGSTITQQLIKNTLLTTDRTWERKLKEIALAFWAERIYTKQEILQMYFNESPYGGTAWGIEAAAETYFNKKAKDLNLAESAYLAGLPAAPTTYSPYGSNPELAKQRQQSVLRRMVEDGYISQDEANKAFDEQLAINPPRNSIKAAHFVMYVRSLLAQKYGERVVSQGGLKVVTSLDLDIQEMAEQAVREEVSKLANLDVSNGAAVVTDPKTGEILAMVGSVDYFRNKDGNFNVATALRQPGSSFKPITYVTTFEQGYTPATILLDTPVSFKNAWETYAPVNYDGKFHGPVSIRTSLGSSYNIPAVKAQVIAGTANVVQKGKDMGLTTLGDPDKYGLSLTLGGAEVTLLDMTTVYGTLAGLGVRHDPKPVLKVNDSSAIVLEDNSQNSEGIRVLGEGISYMIADILSDNNARTPAFGPNSLLNIPGYRVAVKTGTTDNKKDNWTLGYTPDFVVGTWVGNNDGRPMHPSLTSGVTGASPIWNRIMTNLLKAYGTAWYSRPAEVAEGVVDGKKDLTVRGLPTKSVVGQAKRQVKDEKTGESKENITFTDPFTTIAPPAQNDLRNP